MARSSERSSPAGAHLANVLFGVIAGLFILYAALFYWHATRMPYVVLCPPVRSLYGGLLFGHLTVTVAGSCYVFFLARTRLRGILFVVILFGLLGLHFAYYHRFQALARRNWGQQATVAELALALDGRHRFAVEEAALEELTRRGPSAKGARPALLRFIKRENARSFSFLARPATEALERIGMDADEELLELERSQPPVSN